jgi:diguanylate cyclase (GGDEF)-like protein
MTLKRKVLVADASKVVRASLAKQLAEHFEVREEASGESAWQTLVLDSTIVGVVSGVNLTKLDGLDLLERIRESKLSRLKSLPFFLVVSNSFGDTERKHARARGVTDFVAKDSSSISLGNVTTLLLGLEHHISEVLEPSSPEELPQAVVAEEVIPDESATRTDVGVSDVLGTLGGMVGLETPGGGATELVEDGLGHDSPVCTQESLEAVFARLLPDAAEGSGVGVLSFGLDGYQDLVAVHGAELVDRTVEKFSFMVARKVRPEDVISQLPGGRVVIIAPSTTAAICSGFANRICKAMATAQIAVRGQRIDMTVSAGVAVIPEDGISLAGQELLNLAATRLDDAQRAGGNRVVANAGSKGGAGNCEAFVPQLKELLSSVDPAVLRPCLGTVGLQLIPLLKEIESSFRLGLPIDDMKKRLWDKARAERML